MEQRSPVHEIVNELWRALHGLGSPATTGEIERWGVLDHAALSAAGASSQPRPRDRAGSGSHPLE